MESSGAGEAVEAEDTAMVREALGAFARFWWLWLTMAATFAGSFGWAMPWLATHW